MADRKILVLADDLTGALEVGAKFVAAGVRSQVRIGPVLPRNLQGASGAFVVDTETRHVEATEAAQRVQELAQTARRQQFKCIYKKTDSTLRGNIGAELTALIEAYAGSPLLYVPAYPQMGRTVRNGSLYVDGVLVGATCFAHDPLNPVKESHIPALVASQCRLPVRLRLVAEVEDAEPWSITICDGETDSDVEAAARAFLVSSTLRLAAGPSGFATHLARLVDIPHFQPPDQPRARVGLIVNGSLHTVSLQQVEQAKREGFRSIKARSISFAPIHGGWVILDQGIDAGRAAVDFAKGLAKSVCQLLARYPIELLLVFGGDTAYAIVEAFGNPPLYPLGEVMEGIPISRIEAKRLIPYIGQRDHDLYVLTKAGGFGPAGVITSIRNSLTER
jgi:uncharacterized protein YgbK (DUF1537 family)